MNSNPLQNAGDFIADTSTGTYIKVTNMGGHFNLYVSAGADRVPELCGNYPTAQSACRRASYIRTALGTGMTLGQLIEATGSNQTAVLAEANAVLIEALDAAERTEDEIADAINADADLTQAVIEAEHDRVVALVQDAVAGQTWTRFAQANTTRPANLTAAQHHIVTLAARNGGRIVRGGQAGQANSKQIIALKNAGIATITYGKVGNTQVITGGQLTAKGFRYAGVELGSAA